jgi:hypothetical protein
VVSSHALGAALHNPNATGNIAKWAAKFAEFELDFILRHVVKSQVLADFVVGWTPPPCHPRGLDDGAPEPRAPVFTGPHWTLSFDGSSRKQGFAEGVLLLTLTGEQFKYMVHLKFKATNNMAEYEALIFGLSTAMSLGVWQLLVKGESAAAMIHSWPPTCSMCRSSRKTSRSWTYNISLVPTMQSSVSSQQRPPRGLRCR